MSKTNRSVTLDVYLCALESAKTPAAAV